LFAYLENARISVQIDIGFGDAVSPEPLKINFPTILDLAAPVLNAYTRETSVAEKFHAMLSLGMTNSRMKDFYDIWVLLRSYNFDGKILSIAISETFRQRNTIILKELPLVFTEKFYKDTAKQNQWNAFLKKGKYKEKSIIVLTDVVLLIKNLLLPIYQELEAKKKFNKKWESSKSEWLN